MALADVEEQITTIAVAPETLSSEPVFRGTRVFVAAT
jgi:uncharacterized protein (DUF433 family)